MGKVELVERLLNSFEERLPKELAQIQESLAAADLSRLARLAHQFKGTTANVSVPELQSIALRMDDAAQRAQFAAVADCLREIEHAWNRFREVRQAQLQKAHG